MLNVLCYGAGFSGVITIISAVILVAIAFHSALYAMHHWMLFFLEVEDQKTATALTIRCLLSILILFILLR